MSNNLLIKELIEERELFLKTHPHLRPLQNDIDRTLSQCKPEERAKKMYELMIDQVENELVGSLIDLRKVELKILSDRKKKR